MLSSCLSCPSAMDCNLELGAQCTLSSPVLVVATGFYHRNRMQVRMRISPSHFMCFDHGGGYPTTSGALGLSPSLHRYILGGKFYSIKLSLEKHQTVLKALGSNILYFSDMKMRSNDLPQDRHMQIQKRKINVISPNLLGKKKHCVTELGFPRPKWTRLNKNIKSVG